MFQSRFPHRNIVFPNVNLSVQTLTSSEMLSLFAGVVTLSQVVARSGLSPSARQTVYVVSPFISRACVKGHAQSPSFSYAASHYCQLTL